MKYGSDTDKKRKPVWKSIAEDLIIQATPQEELLMILSDFSWICWSEQLARAGQNTLWIEKPCQKSKKNKERAINPEIQNYYWLNAQNKCKINFFFRKADQLVAEKQLIHSSMKQIE